MSDPVFVFGSNLAGIHGRGAALWAKQHRGAIHGVGIGEQGNSYAIPTKRTPWTTLPLDEIEVHVRAFIAYAKQHPETKFQLTPIGCGLAGYTPEQIAPMFELAPTNVMMPEEFERVLERPRDQR